MRLTVIKKLLDWYSNDEILWEEFGDRINARLFDNVVRKHRLPKEFLDFYNMNGGFHDWTVNSIQISETKKEGRYISFKMFPTHEIYKQEIIEVFFYNFHHLDIQNAFSFSSKKDLPTEILLMIFDDQYPDVEIGICLSDNSTMSFFFPQNHVKVIHEN